MSKKIMYLWFLFVTLLTDNFNLYPAAAAIEKPQFAEPLSSLSVNPLLIFMDSEEEHIGGASKGLLRALESEAAPIITTRYLLNHVTVSNEDIALMNKPEWNDQLKAFNALDIRKKQTIPDPTRSQLLLNIFIFEKKELIASRLNNTNPGDSFAKEKADDLAAYPFLIKQINENLYLLLPKKYLAVQQKKLYANIFHSVARENAPADTVTALEYTLGLRINHMKNSTLKEIQSEKGGNKEPFFIDFINKIFVKKSDYLKNPLYKENEYSIPKQALFFMGHGDYDDSLSGLSLKDFSLFLEKLRLVPIHLYLYFSCYASGKNQQSIFSREELVAQNKKTIKDLIFNFPIMNFTTGDDALLTSSLFDFKKFAAESAQESPDFFELAQAFPSEATPQIRKAGLSWFSLLISRKDPVSVVEITETMVKTRTEDLVIQSPPVENVLFSQQYMSPFRIPFKMILVSDGSAALPLFRSLMPGNANHYLVGIKSERNTVTDIVRSFLGDDLEGRKIYFIESIKAPVTKHMKKLLTLQEADQITLNDVIINTKAKKAYFKLNSAWYVIPLKEEESLASKKDSALLETSASYFKKISVAAKIPFFASEAQALEKTLIQEKAAEEKAAQVVQKAPTSSWYSFNSLREKAALALAIGYQLLKPEKKLTE